MGFDIAPVWQLRGKYFVLDNFDTDSRQIKFLLVLVLVLLLVLVLDNLMQILDR